MSHLFALILVVAVVGVVYWIVQSSPLTEFFKRCIYGLCVIAILVAIGNLLFGWPAGPLFR